MQDTQVNSLGSSSFGYVIYTEVGVGFSTLSYFTVEVGFLEFSLYLLYLDGP